MVCEATFDHFLLILPSGITFNVGYIRKTGERMILIFVSVSLVEPYGGLRFANPPYAYCITITGDHYLYLLILIRSAGRYGVFLRVSRQGWNDDDCAVIFVPAKRDLRSIVGYVTQVVTTQARKRTNNMRHFRV